MPALFLKSNQKLVIENEEYNFDDFNQMLDSGVSNICINFSFPKKGGSKVGFTAETKEIIDGSIKLSKLSDKNILIEIDATFKLKVIDRVLSSINDKEVLVISGVNPVGSYGMNSVIADKTIKPKMHKVDGESFVVFEGSLGLKKTDLEAY